MSSMSFALRVSCSPPTSGAAVFYRIAQAVHAYSAWYGRQGAKRTAAFMERPLHLNDSAPKSNRNRVSAVFRVELGEDTLHMTLDGVLVDM